MSIILVIIIIIIITVVIIIILRPHLLLLLLSSLAQWLRCPPTHLTKRFEPQQGQHIIPAPVKLICGK